MYLYPFTFGLQTDTFTACSYWITLTGVFLCYSAVERYNQYRQEARQIQNRNSANPVPTVSRTPAWRRWLNHSIRIPILSSNINIKGILYISVLIVVNVVIMLYSPNPVLMPELGLEYDLYWASVRSTHMGLVNLGVAMLLITRNSILTLISGKSFDETMPLHRWHGLLGLSEICFHVIIQLRDTLIGEVGPNPSFPADQLHIAGLTAFTGLSIVFLSSLEIIRRTSFPLFYISHITGVFLFIGAGFAHQYAVIVFISPPLFFYLVDRVTRMIRSRAIKTHSVEVALPNQQNVTKIVFTNGQHPRKVYPGQFVFMSVHDGTFASKIGNFFNWHPFTISEVLSSEPSEKVVDAKVEPSEGTSKADLEKSLVKRAEQSITTEPLRASVHMKQLGRFTRRIYSQAMKNDKKLHVNVDGPYGSSTLALERHNVVVFLEAGIGITPSLTMLRDLAEKCTMDPLSVQTTAIYFIWATANLNNADVFLPQLMKSFKIAASAIDPPHIECDIYFTQSFPQTTDMSPLENIQYRAGRPAIQDIISDIDKKHAESSIAIQTCGPAAFMRQAANAANKRGWIVRKETFEF